MELKGSKTEKNLWEAFAGESMARNKYTYFASAAKKAGYEQIAAIFQETADNEKEHAKLHFKALSGIGDMLANLLAAAAGEHEEWTEMYPRMAKEAREEGFNDLAVMFEGIAKVEAEHEKRYRELYSQRAASSSGSAATAARSSNSTRPPRSAPSASTRRPTSRSRRRTGKPTVLRYFS